MEQKYIFGGIALVIVSILVVSMATAFGGFNKSFMNKDLTNEEKATIDADRQAMQTAIENNDYTSWKTLMDKEIARMQAEVTQENFNKIVENHKKMSEFKTAMDEAKKTGDYSKVNELKTQLGIDKMLMKGRGQGSHEGMGKGAGKTGSQGFCSYAN